MTPYLPGQVSYVDIISNIFESLGFVVLYIFIGFGPGFVIGIMLANFLFGRGKPTLMDTHEQNKKSAAEHNSQWNPDNSRWQK